MTVLQKIESMLPDFSKNERRIADHILKYPFDLQRYSSVNIAETCNVSRSAVIRFCQKLGFVGFSDFQKTVLSEYETDSSITTNTANSSPLDVYQSCILQLKEKADLREVSAIAEMALHARRVFCYGIDHSRLSAEQMAFRLARNHIDASHSGDSSVLGNYEKIFTAGDMVMVFSISGRKDFAEQMDSFRSKRVGTVLFTMNPKASLNTHVDHVFLLPSAVHSNSPYLLDDAICFMLGIEMVIECIRKITSV